MAGEKGTLGILGDRLRIDMSEKIAELNPNKNPLTVLTKKMKRTRTVYNPEYDWMEQDIGARWDALDGNGSAIAAATTKRLFHQDSYFRVGDILKIPSTGETMLVTAVNPDKDNTKEYSVTRSLGTTAAEVPDDTPVVCIGNVNAEGATLREIKQTEPVKKTNYTQIFRTPVGVTGTLQATKTYGPKPMSWYRHLAGIEHAVDMERAFLFGEKAKASGTQNTRSPGGILEFCTENILNVSSTTLTEQSFVSGWKLFSGMAAVKRYSWPLLDSVPILTCGVWASSRLYPHPRPMACSQGVCLHPRQTLYREASPAGRCHVWRLRHRPGHGQCCLLPAGYPRHQTAYQPAGERRGRPEG